MFFLGGGGRGLMRSFVILTTLEVYCSQNYQYTYTAHLNIVRLIQDSIGSASWARRTPQVGALEHSAPSCAIFISV